MSIPRQARCSLVRICEQVAYIAFTLTVALGIAVFAQFAQAQTYTISVLHSFQGQGDGSNPVGRVSLGAGGRVYAVTSHGGLYGQGPGGTVLFLTATGNEISYSFTGGADGGQPVDAILMGGSAMIGTTKWGGDLTCHPGDPADGCGTIFRMDNTGQLTTLHSFTGGEDGKSPNGALLTDGINLHGVTQYGGTHRNGTIFRTDGVNYFTTVYAFSSTDGSFPAGGLTRDRKGNMYGTMQRSMSGTFGQIFMFSIGQKYSVVHVLTADEGEFPYGELVYDDAGNLSGVAEGGGALGSGTIFQFNIHTKILTVLHSFQWGSDGANPLAGLVRDDAGNLYGTTNWGGDSYQACINGCGIVFKLDPTGAYTILHSFQSTDGARPAGRLEVDSAGNIYGSTSEGGDYGYGTLFKLTPD